MPKISTLLSAWLLAFFVLFILSAFMIPAHAGTPRAITRDMVAAQNEAMAAALNRRDDRLQALHFLHEAISPDAHFHLTVVNPTLPQANQGQAFDMNKEDYINSYIQGTNFISGYKMEIRTIGFSFDPASGEATSVEIMTEQGTALDPRTLAAAEGKPFISTTTCKTTRRLDGDRLVAKSGDCRTEVSFAASI
jgi:hypothetical protein